MSQPDLLKRVVGALDQAGIGYMVTGSLASTLQGEPRTTHDMDFVVAMDRADVDPFLQAFPEGPFYLDAEALRKAVEVRGMFNVIETSEGDKIDFWLLTGDGFDRSRFARRVTVELFGTQVKVSAPEDTILAKLLWAKRAGGSEKHLLDALRVYEVQAGQLDQAYLERWAARLEVEAAWRRIKEEAEPL